MKLLLTRLLPILLYCQPLNAQVARYSTWSTQRLITEIQKRPKDRALHEAFVETLYPEIDKIIAQYRKWGKRFPKEAYIPYMIGKIYNKAERLDSAKYYFSKAIKLAPNDVKILYDLGLAASRSKDTLTLDSTMGKLLRLEKNNPKVLLLQTEDLRLWHRETLADYGDSLLLSICRRFPESKYTAQALVTLTYRAKDPNERCTYYQLLYEQFRKKQNGWFASGMNSYIKFLIQQRALDKALDMATRMTLEAENNKHVWLSVYNKVRLLYRASRALDQQEPQQALNLLEKFNWQESVIVSSGGPSYSDGFFTARVLVEELKIKAMDGLGKTSEAFELLSKKYSEVPTYRIREILLEMARKLSISPDSIWHRVKQQREQRAVQASAVAWYRMADTSRVRLADFKGKITLLCYWFPHCSPCIKEFKLFERSMGRLNKTYNLAYLGVNIVKTQKQYVAQTINFFNFSFLPLEYDIHSDPGNLNFFGAPTNYLIDEHGRILFSNFRIYEDTNPESLELMIKEMNDDWS